MTAAMAPLASPWRGAAVTTGRGDPCPRANSHGYRAMGEVSVGEYVNPLSLV